MQISWTRLPFAAHTREEFSRELTGYLGRVFYEELPGHGYEIREEQIYTAFRMARAMVDGTTLFAEAGSGTGKTFAYLLPAVCLARFTGKPAVVASSSPVLQAQLISPDGDIATLSRILGLQIDARLASDPEEHLCKLKVTRLLPARGLREWKALRRWADRTATGARSEVPQVSDELWAQAAWDPTLACDTCRHRGICHVMAARRHYRAAADLIVTDHRLFARDLFTRAERQELKQLPLLPPYSAVVLDEGHHVPEVWQRTQGHCLSARRLRRTLDLIDGYATRTGRAAALAEARTAQRRLLAGKLVAAARRESEAFLTRVLNVAEAGEGKRHIPPESGVMESAIGLIQAIEAIQDELVTEEAMMEGTEEGESLRAYQDRLDEMTEALSFFQSEDAVRWVEGEEIWMAPRYPVSLYGDGRLTVGTPLLFSSATLEPAYMARMLTPPRHGCSQAGVPFNLARQVLVYEPAARRAAAHGDEADEIARVEAVIRAVGGRTVILLNAMAEVARYRASLHLPFPVLFEGDAERGAMLDRFRTDTASVLVGATFWEGVDVPGESLSCVVIPRLPFPAHDPLIQERRRQAEAAGGDPFLAVDLPEMLLKLKQGTGRLIRTAQDRGVLALLDRSYRGQVWADRVTAVLPDGAARTHDLKRVARFCALSRHP